MYQISSFSKHCRILSENTQLVFFKSSMYVYKLSVNINDDNKYSSNKIFSQDSNCKVMGPQNLIITG